jgi:uncharacterized damage-inducible protein DinB
MDSRSYFQTLAKYNTVANQRLFDACTRLDDVEYRKDRAGSFGSIHALLNHILLGDRIWMGRFEGDSRVPPWLNTILYDDFTALRAARIAEDARIERFFAGTESLDRPLAYTNSKGVEYVDPLPVAVIHMFNHQTHHRGQVHIMLAQTPVPPPSLDLHRIINP